MLPLSGSCQGQQMWFCSSRIGGASARQDFALVFCRGVAQSPAEPTGSVLSGVSENGHRLRYAGAGNRDVGALNCAGAPFPERAASFLNRLLCDGRVSGTLKEVSCRGGRL
jgi:hypothetical protein